MWTQAYFLCFMLLLYVFISFQHRYQTRCTQRECLTQCDQSHKCYKVNCLGSRVQNRGPDGHSTVCRALNERTQAVFSGFTLHFQGKLTLQPLCSDDGCNNILLWNGEVFSGIETGGTNDGLVLLNQLNTCKSEADILSLLGEVHGPWAFIFWQESHRKLWFGRDVFGRRSLLYHYSTEDSPCFVLSSVATESQHSCKEVPAKGIYVVDLSTTNTEIFSEIVLHPWIVCTAESSTALVQEVKEPVKLFHQALGNMIDASWEGIKIVQSNTGIRVPFCIFNDSITEEHWKVSNLPEPHDELQTLQKLASHDQLLLSEELIKVLSQAVKLRVENQSHLCHNCITFELQSQKNTSGLQAQSCASAAATTDYKEPSSDGTSASCLDMSNETIRDCGKTVDFSLGSHVKTVGFDIKKANNQHNDGGIVNKSVVALPLLSSGARCGHARVGILYSGGIDSLVLAALADKFVPADEPIDLLNVAFEEKKSETNKSKKHPSDCESSSKGSFEVPDRVTGKDGLKQLNPSRCWNFVEVNITLEELQRAREEHVKKLVYPLNTVLDDSIGCAIWFAARGQGVVNKGDMAVPYTTSARVLLVGMGADEQLGGYSRHRVKYKTEGLIGLVNEIKMEIERISARNLGRDDRVISDHSRESRFPFLDEDVVSFLNPIPVTQKLNLELPRGIGDKFLLRLAAEKLGLSKSCTLAKRAIQFGSRIAKCENKKEKASDICERL